MHHYGDDKLASYPRRRQFLNTKVEIYQGVEEPPSLAHLVLDTGSEDTRMAFTIKLLVAKEHPSCNIHSNGVVAAGEWT